MNSLLEVFCHSQLDHIVYLGCGGSVHPKGFYLLEGSCRVSVHLEDYAFPDGSKDFGFGFGFCEN
jgi:hypothetical protein